MLRRFGIPLAFPEGERVAASMGSVLHGALMERIPRSMAEHLHIQGMRPYSQSLLFSKERGQAYWRFGVLDDCVAEAFCAALSRDAELNLRQKGYSVRMGAIEMQEEISFEDLADSFMEAKEVSRGVTLSFLTPTSFKRAGMYCMMPEAQLIVQSLVMRWNLFSRTIRLEEENMAERLAGCCKVSRYALHSENFSLEGRRITGFRGMVSCRFGGTELARCVLGLLSAFAPFAGIGIKTALGMGAVAARAWETRAKNERIVEETDS